MGQTSQVKCARVVPAFDPVNKLLCMSLKGAWQGVPEVQDMPTILPRIGEKDSPWSVTHGTVQEKSGGQVANYSPGTLKMLGMGAVSLPSKVR